MTRYLKMLFLAMLAVGMVASGAFAGTISFLGSSSAANTPFAVALEAMGAARNQTATGGTNSGSIVTPALFIIPSQPLVSNTFLTVSFTNAAFDGSTVYLCQLDSSNNNGMTAKAPIGTATPTANSTSYAFVLSSGVAQGNRVQVTTNADTTNCIGNGAFIYRFQPVSSASLASVTYNVASSGTTYDSGNAVNNVANISRQYTTSYSSNSSYIDFLVAPANGSKLASNSLYTTTGANANIANNSSTYDTSTTGSSVSVSMLLSLQDSASWQGISSVYLRNTSLAQGCGSTGTNNAANNSPSGTVNLSVPASAFNGVSPASFTGTVCAQVAGNVALTARTIKGSTTEVLSGTGYNTSIGADTYTTVMTWQTNGYQGLIPYLNTQSIYNTICFINNKSSASAPVTTDILTAESSASLTGLTGLSLGTLAAGTTMRVDFASSVTPYTYSAGTETAGTPIPLTGLQVTDRYSAEINVGATPSLITVNCIQQDPAGSKRAVPVLTLPISLGTYYQQ
jgi:hypothetical protein